MKRPLFPFVHTACVSCSLLPFFWVSLSLQTTVDDSRIFSQTNAYLLRSLAHENPLHSKELNKSLMDERECLYRCVGQSKRQTQSDPHVTSGSTDKTVVLHLLIAYHASLLLLILPSTSPSHCQPIPSHVIRKNFKNCMFFVVVNIKKYEIWGVIISGVCVGGDQSTDT